MTLVHSAASGSIPSETEAAPVNDARLVAELQAVALGIHLVGLDRLPEVMSIGQDNGPPLDVIECPYDDYDPETYDDEGDGLDGCGLHDDGQCDLAGTEWCDWSCPRGGLNLRQTGEA